MWPLHASLPDDLLPPGLGKSKPSLQGPGFLLLLQHPGPGKTTVRFAFAKKLETLDVAVARLRAYRG